MNFNRRKITSGVLIAALLIGGTACSRQRTGENEWGCSFGDGMIEGSRKLKNRLAPGDSGGFSNDNLKTGPADIRFYYIDSNPETADFGATPIEVPARGSAAEGVGIVQTSTEVQVRFRINENFCDLYIDNLKRIDESVDLNYNAKQGESSGWAQFLNLSMNQKLIEATRPVLRDVDYITLYTNGPVEGGSAWDVLTQKLSAGLTKALKDDLGRDYFCGPSYKFDGVIDGELESGCPPLEVTVKSIKPTDPDLIKNLEAIVKNEEAERKLISDTQLANKTATEQATRAVQAQVQAQRQAEQEATSRQAIDIANANAQREISVNQAAADQAIQVANAEAQKQIVLAQEASRRAAEEAKAATDLAVAEARGPVATQLAANRTAAEIAEATFCVELARVGIRCDLYESAKAGGNIVPNFNLSGSADGGSAGSVIVDARS